MAVSSDKSSEKKKKGWQNLVPFKPGQSGNPKGRLPGQRNFRTLYHIALTRIASAQGMSPEFVEEVMHAAAITKALKGDFFFFKDINDRIHGKPKDTIDLGSGGKTLAELIATANAKPRGGTRTTKAPGKNKKRA